MAANHPSAIRWLVFVYSSILIFLLVYLAFVYSGGAAKASFLPDPRHYSFQDVMPLWVPWAGMLGGCTISLWATGNHRRDWDNSFLIWHLARPLLGGTSGTIGVLMVVLVTKAVATETPTLDNKGIGLLTVIAFVLGYREETFRTLVRKVVDVVLGPGSVDTASKVMIVPPQVRLTSTAGVEVKESVFLVNSTTETLATDQVVPAFRPAVPGLNGRLVAIGELQPGGTCEVQLTWTPESGPGPLAQAEMVVSIAGHQVTAPVQLTRTDARGRLRLPRRALRGGH